jgi:histone deacetylase complex subunit SAP18
MFIGEHAKSEMDRTTVCPTLIRTFYQQSEHHTLADFMKELPSPEIYVYTWRDATLQELAHTILRSLKLPNVQLMSFNMVVPNLTVGGWTLEDLGRVDLSARQAAESRTLEDLGFRPGYLVDVAYTNAL